ncbi:hypothetical protein DFH08DRAFT_1039733 [Mycena albidolilacea]|uniref:Uncharacterized protein n=1 Tax=Mycena albidolilacea TaxID=1033008 RepID=A0AAD7EEL3_9AGAR|nr:hypothetical protein DFH08DRAFT_1039733 [Mycena albidolilacea]
MVDIATAEGKRASQIVYASGFVNRLITPALADPRAWKPFKMEVRGQKLVLPKPPSNRAAGVRDLFAVGVVEEPQKEAEMDTLAIEDTGGLMDGRSERIGGGVNIPGWGSRGRGRMHLGVYLVLCSQRDARKRVDASNACPDTDADGQPHPFLHLKEAFDRGEDPVTWSSRRSACFLSLYSPLMPTMRRARESRREAGVHPQADVPQFPVIFDENDVGDLEENEEPFRSDSPTHLEETAEDDGENNQSEEEEDEQPDLLPTITATVDHSPSGFSTFTYTLPT